MTLFSSWSRLIWVKKFVFPSNGFFFIFIFTYYLIWVARDNFRFFLIGWGVHMTRELDNLDYPTQTIKIGLG